jgi:hypothetical protein
VTAVDAATFAAVFAALFVAHSVGDHWVQTPAQSAAKAGPGWPGRWADARHVATLTVTKVAVVVPAAALLGLHLSVWGLVAGLAVDAVSHWWADRRHTLAWLAARFGPGKAAFFRLGSPRPGHDDNPSLGTGAYALDQSWHHLWLLVAALLVTVV